MKLYFIIGDDSAEGEFVVRASYNYVDGRAVWGDVVVFTDKVKAEAHCAEMNVPPGRFTDTFCRFHVLEQEI